MPQKQRKGNLKPVSSSSISLTDNAAAVNHPLLRTLLNKRDENTLFKALTELNLLVQTDDYSTIDYQEWMLIFNKLVLLPFKRCRSLTLKVHGLLTLKMGKSIYSYLPNAITNWIRCRFDPYCSAEAIEYFELCFPKTENGENRIWEFSQKRVLNDILDFFLYETVESLSDLRFVDLNEGTRTFERVMESSVAILIKLLSVLDKEKRLRFQEEYKNIIGESKVWKGMVSSESIGVKREMYRFVAVLVDLDVDLLDEALANIGNTWFPKVFIDSNLRNQMDLWESLIKLTNIRPQIWVLGSSKKPMIPKYLKYLATGCHGLGNVVYPCQLVLFTKIPCELMKDGLDAFTIDFLESCWKGYFSKSSHNDTKEFSKMVLEVAWYCISQNAASKDDIMKVGFLDPIYSTLKKENAEWADAFQIEWVQVMAKMSCSSQVPDGFSMAAFSILMAKKDEMFRGMKEMVDFSYFIQSFASLFSLLLNEESFSDEIKIYLDKNVYVLLRQMLDPHMNLDKSDTTFDGCMKLLSTFKSDYSSERESIFINWIESISLDIYLKNTEKFTRFMEFLKSICHLMEAIQARRIWKKVILWINEVQRYDMLEDALKWSFQCTFVHENISEIDHLADSLLLHDPSRPEMIVYLLRLFDKGLTSEKLYHNIIELIQNEWSINISSLMKHKSFSTNHLNFILHVIAGLGYHDSKKIFRNIADIFLGVAILSFFKSCVPEMVLKSAKEIAVKWTSNIWHDYPTELYSCFTNWIKIGILSSPLEQGGRYMIESTEKEYVSNFWTDIFDNQSQIRPYIWDKSLTIFYPFLLRQNNSYVEADWFYRYIDLTYFIAKKYGAKSMLEIEHVLLDWIRYYYFTINSHRLNLKCNVPFSDRFRLLEEHVRNEFRSRDFGNYSIDEILELKSVGGNFVVDAFLKLVQDTKEIDLLPMSWLLKNIVTSKSKGLIASLINLAHAQSNDLKFPSALAILDGIKSFAFNEHSWMDELVFVIGKMEAMTQEFTETLLLYLHLASDGDNIKAQIDSSKVELLLGHIKDLVGENQSKWGSITDDNAILISKFFRISLKSIASINFRPLIISWALFFTISDSDSVSLFFQIFRLAEEICSEPESKWLNLKDNRDELFYQALSLFVTSPEGKMKLEPYIIAWSHLTQIVKLIPEKVLLESSYFEEIFPILYSQHFEMQLTALLILRRKVTVDVQSISLLFETNTIEEDKTLSKNLVANVQRIPHLNLENASADENNEIIGFLFSWMIIFDNMKDATLRLKNQYISDIYKQELIGNFFLVIWDILGVSWSTSPFDLTSWDVKTLYVETWEPSAVGFSLLAAHLVWRGLNLCPSLIRTWYAECKDRSLSISVDKYVEKHFTGPLISEQLMDLENRKNIIQELSIKSIKTQREITASYTVDEASLDIVFRFPSNYPLRQIEIETGAGKVVGVPEGKWRAWILSITVLLISQNGSVYDALNIFQRNVGLHFEGVEDCAICYSIIGTIDNTLPSKQCKNCKHKFHSGCLFKWFKTSNQSTCPLCRQTSF